MNTKISHIRNLVYFAYIDYELHESEKKFIHQVGARLDLSKELVDAEIAAKNIIKPSLPTDEVLRFILLDDIFNLIASDQILKDEEIKECRKVASDFGFDIVVVDNLISKLKNHIEAGFINNKTSLFIKKELFKLTSQNYSDAKYN